MSSAIVSLVIAVVGVCGTLASALFTQRLSQRARLEELGRAERLRRADQEAAEKKGKTDQLRSCYVQLNANDRNYRNGVASGSRTIGIVVIGLSCLPASRAAFGTGRSPSGLVR
jgi:hypothetical protein